MNSYTCIYCGVERKSLLDAVSLECLECDGRAYRGGIRYASGAQYTPDTKGRRGLIFNKENQ